MQNKRKTLTLGDLAEVAGCSRAVASAVLNGSKGNIRVSAGLRERVLKIARQLDYRPNHSSQALALGRTMTLGVYIDPLHGGGLAGQYHADILAGIEVAAAARNYDVLLVNFAGRTTFADCIDKIARSRIDGLLLLHAGRNERLMDAMLEASSNVVAVDSLDPPPTLQAVLYDHRHAIRLALEHLAGLGHRRLAYFGPHTPRPVAHNVARVEAMVSIAGAMGLSLLSDHLFCRDDMPGPPRPDTQTVAEAVDAFLRIPGARRPTAAVVYNDRLAVTLLKSLAHAGVGVPEDLSLINFENTLLSQAATPGLTSLEHPVYDMSRCATERLIHTIERPEQDDQAAVSSTPWHEYFPSKLIIRQSTSALSPQARVSS